MMQDICVLRAVKFTADYKLEVNLTASRTRCILAMSKLSDDGYMCYLRTQK